MRSVRESIARGRVMAAGSQSQSVVETIVDGVGHFRLNRPERRNAIDAETVDQAIAVMKRFAENGIAVAVLEAEGTVFCSGSDRSEAGTDKRSTSHLIEAMIAAPIFWAARVQGPAVGGGVALAAICPLTVCTHEAWFELPEARSGFLPTPVLAYLEPLLGPRRALQMCLAQERLEASRAVVYGLADEVVAADSIDAHIAARLAPLSRHARLAQMAWRSWQARFTTPEFLLRREALFRLL